MANPTYLRLIVKGIKTKEQAKDLRDVLTPIRKALMARLGTTVNVPFNVKCIRSGVGEEDYIPGFNVLVEMHKDDKADFMAEHWLPATMAKIDQGGVTRSLYVSATPCELHTTVNALHDDLVAHFQLTDLEFEKGKNIVARKGGGGRVRKCTITGQNRQQLFSALKEFAAENELSVVSAGKITISFEEGKTFESYDLPDLTMAYLSNIDTAWQN